MNRLFSHGSEKVRRRCHRGHSDERGATMVEFSISAIVLVLFFGGIFDLGFAYHRHNYMQHVTTRSVRDLLAQLQTTDNCDMIGPYFQRQTEDAMGLLGSSGKNVTWRWRFHPAQVQPDWTSGTAATASTAGSYTAFSVRAEIPWECYFICWVIPSTYHLSAHHSQLIERAGLSCPNGGIP